MTNDHLAVQSWCLRNTRDNYAVAAMVRELGLERIELCDVHADFSDPTAFAKVVGAYRRAGVRIVSIGVQVFRGDLESEQRRFECAAMAGAKHISAHFAIDSFAQAVPVAVKLCQKYGVKLGLHCHGGFCFGGEPEVISHLLKLGGDCFGVNLDTAWCIQLGPRVGNPVRWVLERFPGRLSAVHFKDFVFDRRAQWRDVVVGTGNLDLEAFVAALEKTRFDGHAIVECDSNPEDPIPCIRQSIERIRAAAALKPALV